MFSNFFQKATLIGVATLTSFAMTGTLSANSAQAATSNRSELTLTSNTLNSQNVTGNSSFTKLLTERTEVISLKRGMVICKPGSVKPHTVSSCNRTENKKPVTVTKPAPQRTNNNQHAPVTNPANNKK